MWSELDSIKQNKGLGEATRLNTPIDAKGVSGQWQPKTQVYFIQSEQTRSIKIGISVNPKKRLAALQTSNSGKLVLLGTTTDHQEGELHRRFESIRLNGEWFAPEPPLLDFLTGLGFKPLEKQKLKVPLHDDHPYWGASKLVSGEWYDESDIDLLLGKFGDDCECEVEAEEPDADDECECAGCDVSRSLDRIEVLCRVGDIDGIIYNEDERIICAVFQRDVFARRADYVRGEIYDLSWRLDEVGLNLICISWTERAGFRLETSATCLPLLARSLSGEPADPEASSDELQPEGAAS